LPIANVEAPTNPELDSQAAPPEHVGAFGENGWSVRRNRVWWEIASGTGGGEAKPFANKAVASAGDTVVAITDTQSDPGNVSFSVLDYTSSQSWQTTVPLKGRTANPATAEMIAERPKVSGSYPALSKFGRLVLNSNKAAQEGFWALPDRIPERRDIHVQRRHGTRQPHHCRRPGAV
jgi:hypothetical protein